MAEPGGICVSRVVRDQVRDKLDFAFEDLGEQQVKNFARPVRIYRVRDRTGPIDQALAMQQPLPLPDKPSRSSPSRKSSNARGHHCTRTVCY
jgi:adenylate cyclase